MTDRVKPRLSRGLRDLLPEEMGARLRLIDTIRGVYERYGFVPLGTPAIERMDALFGTAGDETQQSIFRVEGPDDEPLGLRFDLTVPLARVVSQYKDLPRPFRRYQVAPVWRADKPGPGRFREFTQFDLDSVGVRSDVADAEIMAAMCDTLDALSVGPYRVRFSSRRVLNKLMPLAGIPEQRTADVFRVLDKIEKIGMKKIRLQLTEGYVDESGDPIPGLGLEPRQVDRIEEFLGIRADARGEVIEKLRAVLGSTEGAAEEIGALEQLSKHLDLMGYAEDRIVIDLSIARGLAYYTGPVFEAVLLDAPKYGSIFGGGRYDDLVLRFLGERVPATGASIGVDRLLAALVELGRLRLRRSTADVLVTTIDASMQDDYILMTGELRRAGISTEMYLGSGKGPGKQLKYADRIQVPIALLYGGDEKARGVVSVKDLDAGRRASADMKDRDEWRESRPGQREIPRSELVGKLRELIAEIEIGAGSTKAT